MGSANNSLVHNDSKRPMIVLVDWDNNEFLLKYIHRSSITSSPAGDSTDTVLIDKSRIKERLILMPINEQRGINGGNGGMEIWRQRRRQCGNGEGAGILMEATMAEAASKWRQRWRWCGNGEGAGMLMEVTAAEAALKWRQQRRRYSNGGGAGMLMKAVMLLLKWRRRQRR